MRSARGVPIFYRILTALLGVVVVVSGILASVYYIFAKRSLEQHAKEDIRRKVEAVQQHFDTTVEENVVRDLRLLAANPTLDEFIMSSGKDREVNARSVERLFLQMIGHSPNYQRIAFVNSRGEETVVTDRKGRVRAYRKVKQSALFACVKAGKRDSICNGTPFRNAAGRVSFPAGIHKIDEDIGQFGGAVLIDYRLDEFFRYLDTISFFGENPIWVFSPAGETLKRPTTPRATFDPRPYLSPGPQYITMAAPQGGGIIVTHDLLIAPDRKPLVRLVVSIPSSLLLEDIRSVLRFFLIVFILSVIAASLVALSVSRYLSRPIVKLAGAAQRLARGELSSRVDIKASGEVRLLVDSFNRMASDLEKTTVSRDYVDSIIHSMADALLVIGPDGTIRTVNAALLRLLGYEEELAGEPLKTVFPNDSDEADRLIHALKKEGRVDNVETVYRARTLRRIPVLVSGAAIQDKDGVDREFVLIGKDITDRKNAEERLRRYADELRENNREIQNFSYIISHDLRAPLVSITGFSSELDYACKEIKAVIEKNLSNVNEQDRIRLELLIRQDIHEALKYIASSAGRMEGLINSILTLSRVGRRELTPVRIDMESVVREIIDSLAHLIEEKNVRVTIGDLPAIIADRLAMEQVMGNLIDNALKYLEAGRPGKLGITADAQRDETTFHVSDNGRGIAADDIPKVFEIFKRVGRQDVEGEGMGLAYVKALVKRHGGRIWCESEPGAGTTFSFSVPVPAGDSGGAA